MLKNIDTNDLSKITGGALPGPNGEGCTGPSCPRPRPQPNPVPSPIDGLFGIPRPGRPLGLPR